MSVNPFLYVFLYVYNGRNHQEKVVENFSTIVGLLHVENFYSYLALMGKYGVKWKN